MARHFAAASVALARSPTMKSHCAIFRASVILAIAALASMLTHQAAAQNVNGRVAAVTLYRGQAQVTRAIPIDGDARSFEVIVGELPEQIVQDSLFAEGGESVEIRAVR